MHGGTRLRSLAEARLLVDGTTSPVLVVLDELNNEMGQRLWESIRAAVANDEPIKLQAALEDLRTARGDSFLFLHQLALRAVETGRLDRIHVHGLSLPDVICYIPPERVLSHPEPWDVLLQRWRDDALPREPKNLKRWLRDNRFLPADPSLTNDLIRDAVDGMSRGGVPVHPDLVELGLKIRALANFAPNS
jgi:hypothetical protein